MLESQGASRVQRLRVGGIGGESVALGSDPDGWPVATCSQRAGWVWIRTSVSRASRAASVIEDSGRVASRIRLAAPMTR